LKTPINAARGTNLLDYLLSSHHYEPKIVALVKYKSPMPSRIAVILKKALSIILVGPVASGLCSSKFQSVKGTSRNISAILLAEPKICSLQTNLENP
jgi:hypothetical protein